jgi:hypothetical protein
MEQLVLLAKALDSDYEGMQLRVESAGSQTRRPGARHKIRLAKRLMVKVGIPGPSLCQQNKHGENRLTIRISKNANMRKMAQTEP